MSLHKVHQQIEQTPLRPYQMLVIALGVLINMLDGYDIIALSIISPVLTREWQLSPATLGVLFSATLTGMAVGAFLTPVADVWGRRTAIILNLCLMSMGMLLSATATSVDMLWALRFCTGLGVGAMSGCVGTLVFEYCSIKARNLGLGLVVIGYTIGNLLSGYAAPALLDELSWRGVFVFGGALSVLLIPTIYFLLPESLDILVARQSPHALASINKILTRLKLEVFEMLPAPVAKLKNASLLDLFKQPLLQRTLLMAASYFLYMLTEYFFLNWNNQLTTNAGFTDVDGKFITRLTSVGGIIGGIVIGVLSFKYPIRPVSILTMIVMSLSLIAFGAAANNLLLAQVSAFVNGFCIFGVAVVLYAHGATTFPARVRSTGMGLVMSAGRIGSILGPATAGYMLNADVSRFGVCLILSLPVLASIATLVRVPLVDLED